MRGRGRPWIGRRLRDAGVLGLNRRNAEFISACNPRRLYPLVDDKLRTKELALAADMAVPELYGVLSTQHEIHELDDLVGDHEAFVVKPAHGSGGNGIFVIDGRSGDRFRKASGVVVDRDELEHHISNILSGLYSLGGQRDRAMIEYRVRFDPLFERVTYRGVPDVRVIVYRGYPVMAMARLPTRQSDGKANLHQGAVGVGIDLATGVTLGGVQSDGVVENHPDTGHPVAGLAVPAWGQILELAARCHEITGLGYLGVDVVIDAELGPLILELNARPGLAIQIANRDGLLRRLRQVEALPANGGPLPPVAERLEFARRRFGAAA